MQNDAVLQFVSFLENAISSRIAGFRAPYYKVDGTIIGNGSQDFTKEYKAYSFTLNGINAQLIDIPGIEGDEKRFGSIIRDALKKCHLVCYVARESKGIETNTLERIKGYLGSTVEVMGILNIPENPKKKYDGNDYCGEMQERVDCVAAYAKNLETSLLSVIPKDLYAHTVSVAALPGLCALALRDGDSTFADSLDFADNEAVRLSLNRLNRQQRSFLLHASSEDLCRISRIGELRDAISESCRDTPSRIRRNALLRLLAAIDEAYLRQMAGKIVAFKRRRDKVEQETDRFVRRLDDDRIQMKNHMEHAAHNAVNDYLREEMLEKIIYRHIERNTGIEKDALNAELESQKTRITEGLRESVCQAVRGIQDDFGDRISRSTKSWADDMAKYMAELSVAVPSFGVEAFDWKDVGDWAISIGGYATAGFTIGSAIAPGIGSAIGLIIGALVGIVMKLLPKWVFPEKQKEYWRNKVREKFDETCSSAWKLVEGSISAHANEQYESIGELIKKASARKEAVKQTHETIVHFAKDLQELTDNIKVDIEKPVPAQTIMNFPSIKDSPTVQSSIAARTAFLSVLGKRVS